MIDYMVGDPRQCDFRFRKAPLPVVMRLTQLATGALDENCGRYLSYYDPSDAAGRGYIRTTDNPREAMVFATVHDALQEWKRSCGVRSTDGQPNRPLTAYSVEVVALGALIPPENG